jgi:hypothetical protein
MIRGFLKFAFRILKESKITLIRDEIITLVIKMLVSIT